MASDQKTFADAEAYCADKGGIVVPKSRADTAKIRELIGSGDKRVWLPFQNTGRSTPAQWLPTPTWVDWQPGEGDQGETNSAMIFQGGWDGRWYDMNPNGRVHYAVCNGICDSSPSSLLSLDQEPVLTLGNPVVDAAHPDGASNIQFVDTSKCFADSGEVTAVSVWVARTGQSGQRMQIYRPAGGNTYTLVSQTESLQYPNQGKQRRVLTTPLAFLEGDCVGWAHTGQGTIDFNNGGNNVRWKYGIQAVGSTINFDEGGSRTYSYELEFVTETAPNDPLVLVEDMVAEALARDADVATDTNKDVPEDEGEKAIALAPSGHAGVATEEDPSDAVAEDLAGHAGVATEEDPADAVAEAPTGHAGIATEEDPADAVAEAPTGHAGVATEEDPADAVALALAGHAGFTEEEIADAVAEARASPGLFAEEDIIQAMEPMDAIARALAGHAGVPQKDPPDAIAQAIAQAIASEDEEEEEEAVPPLEDAENPAANDEEDAPAEQENSEDEKEQDKDSAEDDFEEDEFEDESSDYEDEFEEDDDFNDWRNAASDDDDSEEDEHRKTKGDSYMIQGAPSPQASQTLKLANQFQDDYEDDAWDAQASFFASGTLKLSQESLGSALAASNSEARDRSSDDEDEADQRDHYAEASEGSAAEGDPLAETKSEGDFEEASADEDS